ncbi:oxidoreductase [Halorientalis sp. IM1011]|uniref:proton-conducting transporter transmembrane domain-containing protein n=1 Tax=Halorientalis sp. IM1011 TaxID=1932360 RepID=UPI00097CD288|nr:proton-conducting transporter membrane subunit [Halorientalis sp. IM1011]AQL44510.1 oxidoreductase [Halorientalis sp. IM1011]
MTGQTETETVGQLPNTSTSTPLAPAVFTRLVWALLVASVGALAARQLTGGNWEVPGLVAVDGLTVLLWVVVTFFSGIVHSYSRRYMAGSEHLTRFFTRLFAFTLSVMVLAAADHVALFGAAWLAMGLVMADLIGTVKGWPQAQAAAGLARRYFLASSALLGGALATLAWTTSATSISGILAAVDTVPHSILLVAAGLLLLAAMVQSALVPFHTWLLSSMTAPTPASALMHAGFVNAGGILLLRFAPVVTVDPAFMLLITVVGATSALLGKLLKTVQSDVKRKLGCSTTGQMGFMIAQAGLGFFGAAITHLILHGFYKAYLFLSAGSQVEATSPTKSTTGSTTLVGGAVAVCSAIAGGVLFALLTGKGTHLDSGLLLTGLISLTTLHATWTAVQQTDLPATLRYGVVPLFFLPAIAVYAGVYTAVTAVLAGVPLVTAPADLTVVHVVVSAAFLAAYVGIETGVYRRSRRLYVALINAAQPATDTLLTATEEYNEY